jgi:hypothetical protein
MESVKLVMPNRSFNEASFFQFYFKKTGYHTGASPAAYLLLRQWSVRREYPYFINRKNFSMPNRKSDKKNEQPWWLQIIEHGKKEVTKSAGCSLCPNFLDCPLRSVQFVHRPSERPECEQLSLIEMRIAESQSRFTSSLAFDMTLGTPGEGLADRRDNYYFVHQTNYYKKQRANGKFERSEKVVMGMDEYEYIVELTICDN